MKFGAQINRIQAAKDNVGNAVSFAQTQDGFLAKVGNALDRMSELAMLAQDETKTDQDRALYDKEFQKLDEFVFNMRSKTFNGVSLFSNATNSTCGVFAVRSMIKSFIMVWRLARMDGCEELKAFLRLPARYKF